MTIEARDRLVFGLKKVYPKITSEGIKEFMCLKEEIDELYSRGYTMGRNFGLNSRGKAVERRYAKQQLILDKSR